LIATVALLFRPGHRPDDLRRRCFRRRRHGVAGLGDDGGAGARLWFIFQMAFTAVAMFDSVVALNPLLIIPSIAKVL